MIFRRLNRERKWPLCCVISEEMLRQVSYPVLLSWFNNLYELNQSTDGRPGGESNNRAQWFMGVKSCRCCRTIPSCQPQTPREQKRAAESEALSTIKEPRPCDLCRNRRLSCLNYMNNRWPCYSSKRMYNVWTFCNVKYYWRILKRAYAARPAPTDRQSDSVPIRRLSS